MIGRLPSAALRHLTFGQWRSFVLDIRNNPTWRDDSVAEPEHLPRRDLLWEANYVESGSLCHPRDCRGIYR